MLLIALGTRPELLKIEPLIKYWESIRFYNYKIWLTFQHEELCKQLCNDWEFKLKIANVYNPFKSQLKNRLDNITSQILQNTEAFDSFQGKRAAINWNKVTAVLVQGDTVSAFTCALTAFHRKIPIIHMEAGLRSYDNDNPYPEEFYRRSISMMSSINLCPTENNKLALMEEKVPGVNFVVGNTILDTLRDKKHGQSNKILCTLHRRENQASIGEWFTNLDKLAEKYSAYEFILPIHKNPDIYKFKNSFKYVKCVEPMEHSFLLEILANSACVITDSGGIAEEATWFKKPIFLCRKSTERPEGEKFYIWTKEPKDLLCAPIDFYTNDPSFLEKECPFGDGKASEKITDVLKQMKILTV